MLNSVNHTDLCEEDKKLLLNLFVCHNNVLANVLKDPRSKWRARTQVQYYRDKYNFKEIANKILVEKLEKEIDEMRDKLLEGKKETIKSAIELAKIKTVQVLDTNNQPVLDSDGLPMYETILPQGKDLRTAWEIIKTELGESTKITENKNINIDQREIQDTLNILQNGIEKPNTTIQD